MRAWALPDRPGLGAGLGGDREAQEDAGSPSAPGARELLGGGGAEGGGEKAPPAARCGTRRRRCGTGGRGGTIWAVREPDPTDGNCRRRGHTGWASFGARIVLRD